MPKNQLHQSKIRLILAFIVGVMPFSWLRVFLYRLLLGYKINSKARLGFGVTIAINEAAIGRASIARFNTFRGPFKLSIGDDVQIGPHNKFSCCALDYARICKIGNSVIITKKHHFDVVGGLEIGNRTWIAGCGSQFWSHGAGVMERYVSIGQDCYIASAVRFTPGTSVGDHCLVSLGSVVTRKFDGVHLLIGGVPAKVIKEHYHWGEQTHI